MAEWPMDGSNDTGWVLLSDGADPSTATDATGHHEFAPGRISNLLKFKSMGRRCC